MKRTVHRKKNFNFKLINILTESRPNPFKKSDLKLLGYPIRFCASLVVAV